VAELNTLSVWIASGGQRAGKRCWAETIHCSAGANHEGGYLSPFCDRLYQCLSNLGGDRQGKDGENRAYV